MNYLQLCQALVAELGISGGTGPSSTTGQTDPDLINAINWIATAYDYINNLHLDWMYLWSRFNGVVSTGPGGDVAPTPTGSAMPIQVVDQNSVWLNYGSPIPYRVRWRPWENARARWAWAKINQRPTELTMRPDFSLYFNYLPVVADTLQYDYWGQPAVLNTGGIGQDTNQPLFASRFHRLIVVRAKIMYAEHEDAPEVMSGSSSEYTDLLLKMEAALWPRHNWDTMSHDGDPELQFSQSPEADRSVYGDRDWP